MWADQGLILPLEKWTHFFLGPWLVVCQSIDISNQMESNGAISNFEMKILCNSVLHNFFYPTFDTLPFDSIWLEISTSWHTSSQGPKVHLKRPFLIEIAVASYPWWTAINLCWQDLDQATGETYEKLRKNLHTTGFIIRLCDYIKIIFAKTKIFFFKPKHTKVNLSENTNYCLTSNSAVLFLNTNW